MRLPSSPVFSNPPCSRRLQRAPRERGGRRSLRQIPPPERGRADLIRGAAEAARAPAKDRGSGQGGQCGWGRIAVHTGRAGGGEQARPCCWLALANAQCVKAVWSVRESEGSAINTANVRRRLQLRRSAHRTVSIGEDVKMLLADARRWCEQPQSSRRGSRCWVLAHPCSSSNLGETIARRTLFHSSDSGFCLLSFHHSIPQAAERERRLCE